MDLEAWSSCPHFSSITAHVHFSCPEGLSELVWVSVPKVSESDFRWCLKVNPKATQMHMGGPLKTCGIKCVGATFDHFGKRRRSILCLLVFLEPSFFRFLSTFVELGVTWGTKWTPQPGVLLK